LGKLNINQKIIEEIAKRIADNENVIKDMTEENIEEEEEYFPEEQKEKQKGIAQELM